MLKKLLIIIPVVMGFILTNCKFEPVTIKDDPVFQQKESATSGDLKNSLPDNDKIVFQWFDDDYMPGGFSYSYPTATTNVSTVVGDGYKSNSCLKIDLDANDYSGAAICLYNMKYDLRPYYSTGILRFWIKSSTGNEKLEASLSDDDANDGKKTVVRVWVDKYATLKAGEWVRVDIPLRDFGKRGLFWDEAKKVEIPVRFQWGMVTETRFEIKKKDNTAPFSVKIDNIQILKNMVAPKKEEDIKYWDEIEEVVDGPANPQTEDPSNVIKVMFDENMPIGGFSYVYGGKTAVRTQESKTKGNEQVLATYQDDNEYSGVSIAAGQKHSFDVSPYMKHGGLEFWVKGKKGGEKFYIGIIDDESDGPEMKVQTKVASQDFVQVTKEWKLVKILFKRFPKNGKWWNSSKKSEVFGQVDWSKLNEVRFSINKFENKKLLGKDEPVTLYFDQIQFVKEIKGVFDPEEFWAKFNSTEKDRLIDDFEDTKIHKGWKTPSGDNSKISASFVAPPAKAKNHGKYSMQVDYKLHDWADCVYNFEENKSPKDKSDWTKHWGLKFWFYTPKPYEAITIQVLDAGNEVFTATTGAVRGWHQLLVPFSSFEKFPYWQPDNAVQNGIFDLKGVHTIDFKPANDGTKGTYFIDDVYLTNDREIKVAKAKELDNAVVTGNAKKVVNNINPGIYGINVALWDGDLLKDGTVKYCKQIKHDVYRYPGGLRADDDHWEEVLKKKDWMVDTDEMQEWVEKVNGELMITVNFGKGTPEEAARWVEHMNVKQKKNVRYWEVGNEIYGNWHPNMTTADDYGKRARVFIEKMKAVDPSIKVTVVWVLEGEWNKTVFEHTKDVADGVNVHHYPQHYGQENDFAVLAAPTSVPEILGNVIKSTKEYGVPGKKYQVWLTEWNSVDFNPGPQTVSVVNGLFVADYLGQLAKTNVDIANYWDVHNDITPQLGDYGYLSRTGSPDGDNIPRSSYWAFKLVANNLQGKFNKSESSNENVTSYLSTRKDGSQALLLINKSPYTDYNVKLNINGLKTGNAIVETYHKVETKTKNGFTWDDTKIDRTTKNIKKGDEVLLKKYTATVIQFGTSKSHTDVE